MGGSSSKVGRALPTKVRTSGLESQGAGSARPASRPQPPPPLASEAKTEGIERDGKDPHFLANLSRIGQVDIHSATTTARTTTQVSEMYRMRHIAEQQAASARPVRNRLEAGTLSNLLDDHKYVTSRSDLEQLAARYTIDVAVLERLGQFVNSPSIGEGTVVRTVVRTVGDDGQERITMQAVWTDPPMSAKESAG